MHVSARTAGSDASPALPSAERTDDSLPADTLPPEVLLEDARPADVVPTNVLPPGVVAEMMADLAEFNDAVAAGAIDPGPEPWDEGWVAWNAGGQPSTAWDVSRMTATEVVDVLADVDLDRVDDAALIELVAGWQRVVAFGAAQAARAAGALAERASMNPEWPEAAGSVAQPCIAADELSMRLAWSRRMAGRLVSDGLAFRRALGWTGDALAAGEICPAKARVIVDGLADQPLEVALAVQEQVLDKAHALTPTALGREVTKAVLRLDPASARSRHEAARTRRRLDGPKMLADGMAGVWAVVDAADATRMDNGIDALARSMKAAGDPRTLDQLRADLLVDLTLGRLYPGERQPSTDAPEPSSGDAQPHDASAAVCPPATDLRSLPQRAVIHVTVPLSTLLGTSEEPGDLAGYGPIAADTARALALGGDWRRIVTDPLSGTVLDVGRTRYRPPAALADHVAARDRTCVNPSCPALAARCDLDHTIPYAEGGATADHNLDPLCRHDHRLKTHGGLHLEQLAPGQFRIRTPGGQVIDVTPGSDDVARRHSPRPPWGDPPPF